MKAFLLGVVMVTVLAFSMESSADGPEIELTVKHLLSHIDYA